jgi:DNA-binding transcriptional LysR family regulator
VELKQLRSFLAVAEELSFSRAALRLNISQPPLSRQIQELEEELGTLLFERGPRGVSLTPAGALLATEAAKLLGRSEELAARVSALGSVHGARLVRIGFVASALYSFLPELLGSFRREEPSLSFELLELSTADQAKALRAGRIDLAFPRSWLPEEGLRFLPLAEEGLSLLRPAERAALGGGRELSALKDQPFIAFSKACAPGLAETAGRLCAAAGFVPSVLFEAGQFDSVLRLVAAGLGWSIVPSLALSGSRLDLEAVELPPLPEPIIIGAALRADEDDPLLLSLLERTERRLRSASGEAASPS